MPSGGCFEIAGELVFADVGHLQAWLEHELTERDKAPLKHRFYDLVPVTGTVAAAFAGKVYLLCDGATAWIAAADLYETFSDPDGVQSRGPACAVVAAAGHGARGVIYFEGLEAKDSFSITVSDGRCKVAKFKRKDKVQQQPPHQRAMAALAKRFA